MEQPELARLFYRELIKNHPSNETDNADDIGQWLPRIEKLNQLLHTIFLEVTQKEKIQFTTYFARIAFAFQKYQVPSRRQFFIQEFRKLMKSVPKELADAQLLYQLGLKAVSDAITVFFEEDPSVEIVEILPPPDFYAPRPNEITRRKSFMRVLALRDDAPNEQLEVQDEATGALFWAKYNLADRNENFRKSIAVLRHYFRFPITLHLLDVEIADNQLRPRAFVIEPDYLVDVTAVAECFRREGAEPLLYLLTKFLPYEVSPSIMKGNIANFFLDEIVANPEVNFQDIFPKVFRINPLAFCNFDEKEVRDIFESAKGHFLHLKMVITEGLPREGILRERCYLEPSFYAPKYGLQGRLDLFYQNEAAKKSAIVELKSGKPFRPNIYGISNNHFTQTLLYDLLIDAAFRQKLDPTNYILYSVLEKDNLKFAPAIKAQQFEALNVRNQILALEQALINMNKTGFEENNIFKRLISSLLSVATGFEKRDIALFDQTYNQLTEAEKKYFSAFAAFIAREHQLAKIGVDGAENANGVAALWLDSAKEKEDAFEIFSYLKIKNNRSAEADAFITFEKTEKTNPLANFRIGDIIVLYPDAGQNDATESPDAPILRNQIFKCTLIDSQRETLTVRLRSRQLNQEIFENSTFWHVEHDLLDSSFNAMYRGLFDFARASTAQRDLLLTRQPPKKNEDWREEPPNPAMTPEQNLIFNKIIHSKDYFLLWGPPGTGKTSVMLKHLVGYFLKNTTENILLLAYTNRAVDEMCEAIEGLGDWVKSAYIRIGSRFSTAPAFHPQLLDFQIDSIKTRQDLRTLLQEKRIFVATVASMTGKMELLQLKKFERVLIDEASQILEPLLVGLLPHFKHFTLIGDHKQLPAVVTQAEDESAVTAPDLHEIGLKNLRHSLFERLFKRANTEGWHWAFDILSHQGRMHAEIMQFPSNLFYEKRLKTLPDGMNDFQLQNIDCQLDDADELTQILATKRVVFINTETDAGATIAKTNLHEARLIAELVRTFNKIYAPENKRSIGVITPYRAQIAQIRAVLTEENFDVDNITIDTVERYQGGARDIVLISLCTNSPTQLTSLMSLSEEGVDRKLNVALTRARKHLVVVGNAEILRGSAIYRWFVEQYGVNV